MPPRPRKRPVGVFPLPQDKRAMARVHKGPSPAELHKRVKHRSLLFQPIENASRSAQFLHPEDWVFRFSKDYRRKYPVQDHAPHFQVVSPRLARKVIVDSLKDDTPLFAHRAGKIRRVHSDAYYRHAGTRLVNKELSPFIARRDRLLADNARVRKHVRVNGFRSIAEMAGSYRALKLVAENAVEIIECKIKIASLRAGFVKNESGHLGSKRAETERNSLARLKIQLERARDHLHQLSELKGYVRIYAESLNNESVYAERAFRFFSAISREKDGSKRAKLNREWVSERVRLHEARENVFVNEMKIAKLCGLHFQGRTIEGIKKDIQNAQRMIRKLRKELGKDDA